MDLGASSVVSESGTDRVNFMHDKLIDSLHDLTGEFQPNELAYLALTSKIEGPLRDRWAYSLHQALSPEHVVAREWPGPRTSGKRRRADLAIVAHGSAHAIIELKAIYSFDVINSRHKEFIEWLRTDGEKWSDCASASIYTVLLVTHPDGEVAGHYERIVKYVPEINRAVHKCGSPEKVKARAKASLRGDLGTDVVCGELCGGRAFGTSLSVLWFVGRCPTSVATALH